MAETPDSPTNGNGAQPSAPAFDERLASAIANRAAAQTVRMLGASDLLDRKRFADEHGLSFFNEATGTYSRRLSAGLGYNREITLQQYRARFRRGGIAKRIVTAAPKATWAGGFDLVEDQDPGVETEFEQAARELFRRLDVWSKLLRLDILSGIGHYGVLFIAGPGNLSEPLDRVTSPDQILFLSPYAEDRAKVEKEVGLNPGGEVQGNEISNPRFGLPETYSISFGSGVTSSRSNSRVGKVHWSRIIHFADGALEDDVLGEPRLESVWDYLDDLVKLHGGGSEAAWKRMDPGRVLKVPPEAQSTDASAPNYFDVSKLQEELDEYDHELNRWLKLQGIEVETLESNVHTFSANVSTLVKLISGAKEIPERILTGSERGELASSQDRSNWSDRISERRTYQATPLVRQLVDLFVKIGALPKPSEYEVVWPQIDELNEQEKAEVLANIALANQRHYEAEGTVIVGANEMRDKLYGYAPLDEVIMEDDDETEEETEQRIEAARMFTPARLRAAKRRLRRRARPPKSAALRAAADRIEGRPRRPELAIVHNAADRSVPRLVALFLALWAAMASAIPAEALESALRDNDVERASAVVARAISATEQEWRERVAEALQAVLVDAGEATAAAATRRGSWLRAAAAVETPWDEQPFRAAAFEAAFDAVDPLVARWAATQAGVLITEIGPETRLAVRELITSGITQGIPPAKLAGQIREVVGLRSDQVSAIYNLKGDLILAKPGTLVTRFPPAPTLRTQPGFRVRIPKGGLTEAQIDKHLARYREMQHNLRARTIARTETMRSANEGQRAAWRQAVASGEIAKDQKRVWITAGDSAVRESHASLEGEVVGLEEPFSAGIEPGEEPNCRCVAGLATAEDLERAGDELSESSQAPLPTSEPAARELTDTERRAVYEWGNDGWRSIRNSLDSDNPSTTAKAFKSAVENLPRFEQGQLYRGMTGSPDAIGLREGAEFSQEKFASWSKRREAALDFTDPDVLNSPAMLLQVGAKPGASSRFTDINDFIPEELRWGQEVVNHSGARFRVQSVRKETITWKNVNPFVDSGSYSKDLWIVELEPL